MIFRSVFRRFETWIDPFARKGDLKPPDTALKFLWFYVSQAKLPFLLMLIIGGLVALLEAALFYFVGRLVDVLDTADKAAGWHGLLAGHALELAAMLFVVSIGRFLVTAAAALVEEQTIVPGFYNLVRWQAYAHVARQSLSFFQNDFAGRIVTKVWQAGQATGDFMTSLLQVAWFILIYAVTTIALIAQLDWRLAGIVVVWIACFAVLARLFVPRIRRYAKATAEASSMLNGRLVDSYSNAQTLKLYGRAEDNDAYIRQGFARFLGAILPFTRSLTGVRASLAFLSGIMMSAIGVFSIDLWLSGAITTGAVAFTMALVLRLNMLFGRMMAQLNGLMRNFGTIQNSMDLISRPIGLVDPPDAHQLAVQGAGIRFEAIAFHYGRESGVIDDLSLTIAPGERVGIVGRSGAGKSTLVNLLLRFYDLEGGRILIDGQDIAEVTQESLRASVGMVTQDSALLHRSIRDNIRFGRPGADDEALAAAARRAEAWSFIETVEDQNGRLGLDAHVGERGVKLSGGQRQRIAIARVMLKDAPILVLDEATSALDSEVEAVIQENLGTLMEGKTVIAIAHRLSTIAELDRLIVMDEGRIVETGTHDELVATGGLYADLWRRQSGGFIAGDIAAE
ncbi:ABC transporter ATP-binding protein [Pararhizobium mangrovi]|uniref:ABC transporter ATP-binding protein n=1 Tax=Pararhizobium mangrovi TaxID=2590452 RepID=A0A506U4M6_9HYPH|nr:ABC transporter ATP-binding protein [Pararhizobium mangrovi]TPW29312.1 ABC transporter ATP-binding protein [Pararhizobium mangrovi]